MWDTIGMAFVVVLTLGCAATTFKLAIFGNKRDFGRFVGFWTNPVWGLFLFLLVPMYLGAYGRGEFSPFPWSAFQDEYEKHGFLNGIGQFIGVSVVDLWALWLPAALYLESHPEADKRTRYLVRTVNLLVGVILLTPGNPLALLLAHIPVGERD